MYCEHLDLNLDRRQFCHVITREIQKTTEDAARLMMEYFIRNLLARRKPDVGGEPPTPLEKKMDEFHMTGSEFLLHEVCSLVVETERENDVRRKK